MISRRAALGLGGGVVAAATFGRAFDQGLILGGERPGLRAWRDWNDGRYAGALSLVSAGVLASSPQNMQPWRFGLSRYGVDIFEDATRDLGAIDPFGRERLAGLGAAIHNMALAAVAVDAGAVVRLLPDPDNLAHVARIELGPDGRAGGVLPMARVIGRRHVDRRAWAGGVIDAGQRRRLMATAGTAALRVEVLDAAAAQRFAALTMEATAAIVEDEAMLAARHRWWRHGRREQDRTMDGLGLATTGVSPLVAATAAMLPAPSARALGEDWLAATRDTALPTASAYALISARDPHDRRTALLAGMAWQRLHLVATAMGLVAQPLNQLPEIIDRERDQSLPPRFATAVDALLRDAAWRPTFAVRLGYPAAPAAASPRRPVSAVVGQSARLAFETGRSAAETAGYEAAMARKQAAK